MMTASGPAPTGDSLRQPRARRHPARERVRQTADELLYREGIGTPIDRIIAESNVSKQSVYGNFRSKDGLIEDYLERRHDTTIHVLTQAMADHRGDGATAQVLAAFRELEHRASEPEFRGCAFVVAAAEAPHADSAARRWARHHKLAVRGLFEDALKGAAADPSGLADQIMLVYDGAMVSAALRPESKPFTTASTLIRKLLD